MDEIFLSQYKKHPYNCVNPNKECVGTICKILHNFMKG